LTARAGGDSGEPNYPSCGEMLLVAASFVGLSLAECFFFSFMTLEEVWNKVLKVS
jgi:hypothetical protein